MEQPGLMFRLSTLKKKETMPAASAPRNRLAGAETVCPREDWPCFGLAVAERPDMWPGSGFLWFPRALSTILGCKHP